MSRDEIHNEKHLKRCQAAGIIEFPNSTMIQGIIEIVFSIFPCESMKKW